MRYARLSAQVDGAGYPCQAQGACAPHCTRRRDNAHKIEELEVLYRWHPWFGRVVHVHEVIEQRAGGVFRCSPDGDASRRWLELPQWMFDRTACLAIRMAAAPCVVGGGTCVATGSSLIQGCRSSSLHQKQRHSIEGCRTSPYPTQLCVADRR